MTIPEVAIELHCSAPTIRRRIREGALPATKLGDAPNAAVRIPRDALQAWLWGDIEERG